MGNRMHGLIGGTLLFVLSMPMPAEASDSVNGTLAAGDAHSCMIKDGGVVCWGRADLGQLGDKNLYSLGARAEASWVPTIGANSGATRVTAGNFHSCAVVEGGVKCWGANAYGQLGRPESALPEGPDWVETLGPGSGVNLLSAGSYHTCAARIAADGWVKCWGRNQRGQLGTGDQVDSHTPQNVETSSTAALELLTAGGSNTCTVMASVLRCWGDNTFHQLKAGTPNPTLTPAIILDSDVGRASMGPLHLCATFQNQAWCSGANQQGQIGVAPSPKATGHVLNPPAGLVSALAAGTMFSCAKFGGAGDVHCWGIREYAQGGPVQTTPSSQISKIFSGASQIALGGQHACTIKTNGDVACWGMNYYGQLGQEPSLGVAPVRVAGISLPSGNVLSISGGEAHTCIVVEASDKQQLGCWGSNRHRQIPGTGELVVDASLYSEAENLTGSKVGSIVAGRAHSCWLVLPHAGYGAHEQRKVYCVGDDEHGQLGIADAGGATTFDVMEKFTAYGTECNLLEGCTDLSTDFYRWGNLTQISAGNDHNCVLLHYEPVDIHQPGNINPQEWTVPSEDRLLCWGSNGLGQLTATMDQSPHSKPVQPYQTANWNKQGLEYPGLSANGDHTCAVTSDHRVVCFGWNASGQAGGSPTSSKGIGAIEIKEHVNLDVVTYAAVVATGGRHSCFISLVDSISCWGDNTYGQLGIGLQPSRHHATKLDLNQVHGLALGLRHSCALASGRVYCWGSNRQGQLGISRAIKESFLPLENPVSAFADFVKIGAGPLHTCAARANGDVWCWGNEMNGRLGNGKLGYYSSPISILTVYDDEDSDGIADPYDPCDSNPNPECDAPEPEEPPLPDGDNDGIPDMDDLCPSNPDPDCTVALFKDGFEQAVAPE